MSGDNQHFIPRLYLKGFKVRGIGGGKQAWVFRQSGEPGLMYLDDIAADDHFYSPPDPGSLDETITKYENRLAAHFKILRKAPLGPFADSGIPAEVVAHLTVRTESIRTGLGFGAKQMALKLFETFQDEETLKRVFSLDGDVPDERFKRLLTESLKEHEEKLKTAGLSREAAERIVFVMAKESFPQILARTRPAVASVSGEIYQKADELVAASQRKMLAKSIVPEERVEFLKALHWEIIATGDAAVLPDCVAIALQPDGRPKPLLFSDKDATTAVIIPLDHRRLLAGRRSTEVEISPHLFNIHAISCSETFFVSSERSPNLEEWAKYVGVVSRSTMLETMKDVFAEYKAPAQPPKTDHSRSVNLTLTFKDADNKEAIQVVGERMKGVLSWAAERISLERIDEITFTNDVSGTASQIARGYGEEAVEPVPSGLSAKTVSFLKAENIHVHIVMSNDIAATLLAEPEGLEWGNAVYFVLFMLAEANCAVEFDKTFPGKMLRPHTSLFNLIRYEPVSTAWTGYIASRFSSSFWSDGVDVRRNLLKDSVERLKAALPELGSSFGSHGDHGRLIKETLPYITVVLAQSACLAGLADGRDIDILADNEVMQVFRAINLAEWYESYVGDLRSIWERRGQWRSEKEFMSLSRHTERLLWQCGMVLSEAPGNQCRLDIPNVSALQNAQLSAR